MLIFLLICFALLAGVFAARLYMVRRSVRQARRDLRHITEEEDTNQQLTRTIPDKEVDGLLGQVNGILVKRQRERIDYQNKEKELRQQIANISHDLRTPLTAILGYTQLLDDPGITPEERANYLSIITRRAKVLQELITSFYDLSRVEAGEYLLTMGRVDANAALCEILAAFYKELTDSGLTVETKLPEGALYVAADEKALLRVCQNLVQNALRHGKERLTIGLWEEGRFACLTFSNDAPGMTGEDAAHVFERFYTADKMRTGRDTGLGLTIAKQFVERMGGTITARLEGSRFTITIHLERA